MQPQADETYGRVIDEDNLALREISADYTLGVWTQDPSQAQIWSRSNAKDILGHFGAIRFQKVPIAV